MKKQTIRSIENKRELEEIIDSSSYFYPLAVYLTFDAEIFENPENKEDLLHLKDNLYIEDGHSIREFAKLYLNILESLTLNKSILIKRNNFIISNKKLDDTYEDFPIYITDPIQTTYNKFTIKTCYSKII